MNNTPWKYSLRFINKCVDDNETFRTKQMLDFVRCRKRHVSASTLYWHRVILARLGFLKKLKHGVWLKIKGFPYDVGKAEAERVAWQTDWKSWFIQYEDEWPLLEEKEFKYANS